MPGEVVTNYNIDWNFMMSFLNQAYSRWKSLRLIKIDFVYFEFISADNSEGCNLTELLRNISSVRIFTKIEQRKLEQYSFVKNSRNIHKDWIEPSDILIEA